MNRIFLANYFRSLRSTLLFAVATFIVGMLVGVAAPQYFAFLIRSLMSFGADVLSHGPFKAAMSILAHNLMASYILIISGALFGIPPILALGVNGAVVGAAIHYRAGGDISSLLFHIAPHGIFELPAYFICAAISLHCGLASLRRLGAKELLSRWYIGTRVYIRVVFPLLIIAAFIEAYISVSLP